MPIGQARRRRTWWRPKGIEPSSHAVQVQHLPVGTRPRADRLSVRVRDHARGVSESPRVAMHSRISRINFNREENFDRSRRGELNPPTSVWRTDVSPQHFTCKTEQLEQEEGVEPVDFGVGHRCVTATLPLLGGPVRDRLLWTNVGAGARSKARTWVGRESNPRHDGVRIRCKTSVCYRPVRAHLQRAR